MGTHIDQLVMDGALIIGSLIMSWRITFQLEGNKDQVELRPKLLTLEEFQLSTTMLITMKPVVKDHNDYIWFSYYGHDMDATSISSKSDNREVPLLYGSDVAVIAD